MARLVVRNRDKVNHDSQAWSEACMKRGMVVDILPDGMSLGKKGDVYSGWTVVEVPGVPPADLWEFLASEPSRRRTVLFDLDGYAGGPLSANQALSLKRNR
jgi:hypothetical protein